MAGLRRGRADKRTTTLVHWCLHILRTTPLFAIHENVIGFDISILEEFMATEYVLHPFRVAPRQVGFHLIERPRLYVLLLRKKGVQLQAPVEQIYHTVAKELATSVCNEVKDVFVARKPAVLAFENQCRSSKKLRKVEQVSRCWEYLLTEKQLRYLKNYKSDYKCRYGKEAASDPNFVCDLAQDPAERPSMTTKAGAIPTLRHSGNKLYSPHYGRLIVPVELAVATGFPCVAGAAKAANVPLDNTDYSNVQLGNGMHVANVGCLLAAVLACVTTGESPAITEPS